MNVKSLNVAILVSCALTLAACSTTPKVFTDSDSRQDFSSYKSFSWTNANPMLTTGERVVSPLIEPRLMKAIKANLMAKGYDYVEDKAQADIAVSFSVGARDTVKLESDPAVLYDVHWRWGGPNYGTTLMTRTYTKGSLAIDVYDIERNSPVWHGMVSSRLKKSDLNKPSTDQQLQTAVDTVLQEFPAK